MNVFSKPQCIFIYDDHCKEILNLKEITNYLKQHFKKAKVSVRKLFEYHRFKNTDKNFINKIASNIAKCKIVDFKKQVINSFTEPLLAEIEYEKKRIKNLKNNSFGIVYDGFSLQKVFENLMPKEETSISYIHIIFTNQLFATFSDDGRYHLRTGIYGMPSVISTSGIVEAPAKPKEFYAIKNLTPHQINLWKEKNKDKFIDYNDERLTEIAKGYAMQAIFYYVLGNPFCKDRGCRLFNAHWQKDLIYSQIKSPNEFCKFHKEVLKLL